MYCVDTSVFINLKHYPRRIFPTIWGKIEVMIDRGELISHIEVLGELEEGGDEIYIWCKQHKKMFKDMDPCQIEQIKQFIQRLYTKDYWDRQSLKKHWADPWIIALARCEGAKVVADEKNAPNKIPHITSRLGIPCLDRFGFFEEIGVKY